MERALIGEYETLIAELLAQARAAQSRAGGRAGADPRAHPRLRPRQGAPPQGGQGEGSRAAGRVPRQRSRRARRSGSSPPPESRDRMRLHGGEQPFDLTGKVALVTGAYRGLGFAIAQGLAQAGATVVLNGRKPDALAEAAKTLTDAGLSHHDERVRRDRRRQACARGRGDRSAARPSRHPRQQCRHPAAQRRWSISRSRIGTTSSPPTSPRRSSCRRRCCRA